MNKPAHFYLANWKMGLSFTQELAFATKHRDDLIQLQKTSKAALVLCPSFPALYPINQLLKNTDIALGAQTCSAHESGAYTGEVSARSLAEVGCSYCIVGHSERRAYNHEISKEIAQKIVLLIKNNIVPVLCVGESKSDYEQRATLSVLEQQLTPVFELLAQNQPTKKILIAYEPTWSIGTGVVPPSAYLQETIEWVASFARKNIPNQPYALLYGGSVDATTAPQIKDISGIDGFLIGGASLDFQKFKNIVLLD